MTVVTKRTRRLRWLLVRIWIARLLIWIVKR
jgi:hypothetical protein